MQCWCVATISGLVSGCAAIGGKARCHDNTVIHGASQECCSEGGSKVIVGIAKNSVDKHEAASHVLVPRLQGIATVDQKAGWLPAGFIHSVQSGTAEAHGAAKAVVAENKSARNMVEQEIFMVGLKSLGVRWKPSARFA